MLHKTHIEFPSKQLNNSISNVKNILTSVKLLTEKVVTDESLKPILNKCIEVFQGLLVHAASSSDDRANEKERKTIEAINLRQKQRQNTINPNELARLKQLEREGYR
jgi:hypothetical protein